MFKFPLVISILLLTLSSEAQKLTTSLYDDNGRLIADTTFKITHLQLTKWLAIEDSLTKKILNRIRYPQPLHENGVVGKIIISFTVDSKGMFNDFRFERYDSKTTSDPMNSNTKMFTEAVFGSTLYFSGNFAKQGFMAGKKPERYYLPFDFKINPEKTVKQMREGWLTLDMQEPKVVQPVRGY